MTSESPPPSILPASFALVNDNDVAQQQQQQSRMSQTIRHSSFSTPLASTIYGPFYTHIARATLLLDGGPGSYSNRLIAVWTQKLSRKSTERCMRLFNCLTLLLVVAPLLAWIVCLSRQLHHSFSGESFHSWNRNLALLLFSCHGLLSAHFLHSLNVNNFFAEFVQRFSSVLKNRTPVLTSLSSAGGWSAYRKWRLSYALLPIFVLYVFTFSVVLKVHAVNISWFWSILELVIELWAGLISVSAVLLSVLSVDAILFEYRKYKEELVEAGQNGHLQHADLLTNYGARQLELLGVIRFMNQSFGRFLRFAFLILFSAGVVVGFAMEKGVVRHIYILHTASYSASMLGLALEEMNFLLLSVWLLWIHFHSLADLCQEVEHTKSVILFERSIWTRTDEKLLNAAWNIVNRIECSRADYIISLLFNGQLMVTQRFHEMMILLALFVVQILLVLDRILK